MPLIAVAVQDVSYASVIMVLVYLIVFVESKQASRRLFSKDNISKLNLSVVPVKPGFFTFWILIE